MVSLGWNARCYSSAAKFLDDINNTRTDCLVLDLQMPGLTGADLLETMKTRGISLPVVVITALKDDPMVGRAQASGAFTVLSKPFRDQALVDAIEAATGHLV
ncbi:MAG: response regulator, partial [Saprospiraceae bacterium]|nr:response regulator [Saprospiraceae bacterium]